MSELTAKFKLVDEMSSKLESMADAGQDMISRWEEAGKAVNSAFGDISGTVTTATGVVSGVASTVDELTASAEGCGTAAQDAAAQMDYWTAAADNYNKSALEAVYSTEELVEKGLKSAEALQAEQEMMALCERSANELSQSMDAAAEIERQMNTATEEAARVTQEVADNEKVSAETKEELARASEEAADAMNKLLTAQQEAADAMENYNAVMESGNAGLNELEGAAERAGTAAERLAEANARASNATDELTNATQKASEEAEKGGEKGVEAINGIASALAAAGITAMVKESAEAVYELAEAFSEAESTVVKATGATGEALDGLTASMMAAYSASKSNGLDDTAAVVGEINTRLGYTDDLLTTTTGLFLDFSTATGENAASSVRSVTQLMNQWQVPATEMESILDRLTYAGQASGISVGTLSQQLITQKPILDQIGFSLDEAIAMFMQFELAGTNASTVMMGFRTALSSGAISSLEDLYDIFDQISSGMITAADASEIFGSRAGPAIVNAVNSGTLSLDGMVASLEAADGTLAKTATNAQTLEQKWTQAGNNMSAAFTNAVEPAVNGISSAFAGLVNGIGTFLNKHPVVTKAITALGIGLGVVVAGIAGVTFVTTVAIPAVTAFGVALNAALGPIGWVALAITGVVAAGTAFVAMMSDAGDETKNMTATTKAQYYELQDLNAEYEETCEKYGENSEEALRLRYQVDDLTEAFEANRQTVEEFKAEVDELCKSVSQATDDFNSAMTEIDNNETETLALIQKYEDLATQAELTGAQQKELEAITRKLNETYPELAQKIGTATANTEDYVEAMKIACEQEAEMLRQKQMQDSYVEALAKRTDLAEELAKAEDNLARASEAREKAGFSPFSFLFPGTDVLAGYAPYFKAIGDLNAAIEENEALIAEIEQAWEDESKAIEDAITVHNDYALALESVYSSTQSEIEGLCAKYDEVYQAALESFEGQFGLFDRARADATATVANAQAALNSQLAYWQNYNSNIETLSSYGNTLTGEARTNFEALMTYVQSGSEEAAGLAQSIANSIKSGNTQAVAELSKTIGSVQAEQEKASAKIADWSTDFSSKLDEIGENMKKSIEDMDMSDEAETAAKNTIDAYIQGIKSGEDRATAAARSVARQVAAAFSSNLISATPVSGRAVVQLPPGRANGTTNAENIFLAGENGPELIVSKAAAYATGTTDSANAFIAGENGPELIVGQQGSTVFPTRETDRLIDALSERRREPIWSVPETDIGDRNNGGTGNVKRIFLEIGGNGSIEISGGTDRNTVLEILTENLKPVLMNIIQGEIYEEGELSYEY